MDDETLHLLALTRRLLDSIASRDWDTYSQLCDPSLTAFEPEAVGHLVEGLDFHRFYFDESNAPPRRGTTLSGPHVRLMGDVGVVCYVRLEQRIDERGGTRTFAFEETRIWQRHEGTWRHVHFHRTAIAP